MALRWLPSAHRVAVVLLVTACGSSDPSGSNAGSASTPGSSPDEGGTKNPDGTDRPFDAADAGADGSPTTRTTVPMFVGIGHEGRTTVSCDDGKTWRANRSDDDTVRCFDPLDCDHNGHAGRGLAFDRGWFVANFGWGAPGNIRRSRDGVGWETVDQGANFASMVAGNGKLVAISGAPRLSTDLGKTWTAGGDPTFGARRGGFGGSGLFVMVDDGPKAATSLDGITWEVASSFPSTCGKDIQWSGGIGGIGNTIVVAGGDGIVCSSSNDGASWVSKSVADGLGGRLVKRGDELVLFGTSGGKASVFRSKDGVGWSATPTVTKKDGANQPGPPIGAVAVSPTGTFVATNDGWQVWYEKQKFYRSVDGVTWEELPSTAFVGSHPMTHIVWAEGAPSTICPL